MRNADRISFFVIIGICIYFWMESRGFGKYGVLFPQVIVFILGLLACVLFVVSFIEPKDRAVFRDKTLRYGFILLIIFLFIAWIALIRFMGFVVSSILFIKKKRTPLAITVKVLIIGVTVGAFYLFFSKLLLVSFPKGFLF